MENFRFEPVIGLIILILVPAANYVLARMRRRFEATGPDSPTVADMGMRRHAAAPAPVPSSRSERSQRAPMIASPRRSLKKALFGTQQDARRAMVMMTVLGPCRADESAR